LRALLPSGDGDVTELAGQPIALAHSGMGMLMAAAKTQSIIERFHPTAVLNYGCAGAHRPELLLGDIVVGTRVVAYDNAHEAQAVECAPHLVEAARRAAHEHEPWPVDLGWPEHVPHRAPRLFYGTVASADRWNRTSQTIERLVTVHDSLCEDMEAAAIGVICDAHDVPFMTIKDISNNELLRQTASGSAMLAEMGTSQLARRAAAFTFATLQAFVR
jgi:adenosylhomocysteine nucleosidase